MPVAIEPRRSGKHKMHAIMPQEVRKQSLYCIPLHQLMDRGQGVESNYLKNGFQCRLEDHYDVINFFSSEVFTFF